MTAVDQLDHESEAATAECRRALHGQPPAPTGLVGRVSGVGEITLTWDAVTPVLNQGRQGDALNHYELYRREANGSWMLIQTLANDQTTATDAGRMPSTKYAYRVVAVDGDGDASNPSGAVEVQMGNGIAPAAPVLSVASVSATQIAVSWLPGIGGDAAVLYRVFRSTSPTAGFTQLREVAADGTLSFVDSGLMTETPYYYRVYAEDVEGEVSTSSQVKGISVAETLPFLSLTAPSAGDTPLVISADTKVRGIVDDPNDNVTSWRLVLRPVAGSTPVVADIPLAQGNTEIGLKGGTDGLLGTLQPLLVPNGLYRLVLQAVEKFADNTTRSSETVAGLVQIKTDAKLGNLNLPFVDLKFSVPGTTPFTATLVYDSSLSLQNGDFGYGWRLQVSDVQLRTTARASERQSDATTLRFGDLVYLTLPSGQQHAFQFIPKPSTYAKGSGWPLTAIDPLSYVYSGDTYTPQFVCVDGTGATLSVNYTDGLRYDSENKEFFGFLNNVPFNPASPAFGGGYTLTTLDQTQYEIDAKIGVLKSSSDAAGNVTTYGKNTISSGIRQLTIHRNNQGHVDWISMDPSGVGAKVSYEYDDATGDLKAVIDQTGHRTQFFYEDPSHPHFLTRMLDDRGVSIVTVAYDASGKVLSMTDARGNTAGSNYGSFNGDNGSAAMTDLSGNDIQSVYDRHGNVTREVRTQRDASGNVTGYVVTVHHYGYYDNLSNGDIQQMVLTGKAPINLLVVQEDYQPIAVSPMGDPYAVEPAASQLSRRVTYYMDPLLDGASFGLPHFITTLASDGVTELTTEYGDYHNGKPGWIKDPTGNESSNAYDSAGHLIASKDALGQILRYTYTSGGSYTYKDGTTVDYSGLPKGLLLETYRDGASTALTRNVYYTDNARDLGRLKSTTDLAGLTVRYTYTADGAVAGVYREYADGSTTRSTSSSRVYDAAGRTVETVDENGVRTGTLYNGNGKVVATGTLLDSAPAKWYEATSPQQYFRSATLYTYDLRGNLIRTQYADGSETRSVYDAMGRVIWSSDRYVADDADTTRCVATRTVYDSLGNVAGTSRYKGVLIQIQVDVETDTGVTVLKSVVQANIAGEPTGATCLSESSTLYDAAGRVVVSTDANGQRTGTVYYPNGRVQYTGKLKSSVIGAPTQAADFELCTSYSYDSHDRLIRTVYSDGTETRTAYDAKGRVEWTSDRYNPADNAAARIATQTQHDALGQVEGTRQYKGVVIEITAAGAAANTAGAVLLSSTSQVYDDVGRVIVSTSGSQLRTGTLYYPDGSVHYTGELKSSVVTPASVADFVHYTAYQYCLWDASRMLDGKAGAYYNSVIDAKGHETRTYSDPLGRGELTVYHDGSFAETLRGLPGERVTQSIWTGITIAIPGEGWPTSGFGQHGVKIQQRKTGDAAIVTQYLYDTSGNLTDVWMPAVDDPRTVSHDLVNPHWQYTYDAQGNQTVYTYDVQSRVVFETTFSKAQVGQLLQLATGTDWRGQLHQDQTAAERLAAINAVLQKADNPGSTEFGVKIETTYDALGRRDIVRHREDSDGDGVFETGEIDRTTDHDYDAVSGSIAQETTPEGVIYYAYNDLGQKTDMWTGAADKASAFNSTKYEYDSYGRLWKVIATRLNGQSVNLATVCEYDAVGNLEAVTQPNDVVTTYTYDALNRLDLETVTDAANNVIASYDYQLRSDGLRSGVIERHREADGRLTKVWVSYTYDNLGRLISEQRDSDPTPENGVDNFGTWEAGDYTITYDLDLVSNRVGRHVNNDADAAWEEEIVYTYNDRDQLLVEDSTINANDVRYAYDDNGSQTLKSSAAGDVTYTWDLRGRMVKVDNPGTEPDVTYGYDHEGVRVWQKSGTSTTTYLNDRQNDTGYTKAVEEHTYTNGNQVADKHRSYVIGHQVIAQQDKVSSAYGDVYYLVVDGHGSTRMLLKANAQLALNAQGQAQVYDYDAYGKLLNADLATETNWLFGGDGIYDPASGWTYHLARWRDGFRFTSFDSFEADPSNPADLHKYLYAGVNPVQAWDASGQSVDVVSVLNYMGSFLRYALDSGRSFSTHWGNGHRLASEMTFDTSDPFELAAIANVPLQQQMADIINESRRGAEAIYESTSLMWMMIDETWRMNEDILLDLVTGFASARACFPAGTPVVVRTDANGRCVTRAIEEIHEGDYILTRDERDPDAPDRLRQVLRTFSRESDHILTLSLRRGNDDRVIRVRTTDGHPVWVIGRGWTKASDLLPGDRVVGVHGSDRLVIVKTEREVCSTSTRVYTFEVDSDHTYFVGGGEGAVDATVWAHNACVEVNENAHMASDAARYQSGAKGYKPGKAPALTYNLPGTNGRVKFDGVEGRTLIDRKLSFYSSEKGKRQLVRMSAAVKQNPGWAARIEVPTQAVKNRGQTLLDSLGITNIKMKVVPL